MIANILQNILDLMVYVSSVLILASAIAGVWEYRIWKKSRAAEEES
jgi:hypothetical protein